MHDERFDTWTSMFAAELPRRGAIGAVLSLAFLGHGSPVSADRGTAKRKGHGASYGRGHAGDEHCAQLACDELPVPGTSDPEFCCKDKFCSCGGECCGQKCFQIGDIASPDQVFCCVGKGLRICGKGMDAKCCDRPCNECQAGQSGIAGSYRRRR